MSVDPTVRVRRIYAEPAGDDGMRVFVDRLWPRGITKSKAHLDEWCQQVAPSTELRTWYRHDPAKFFEFASRYREELGEAQRAAALSHLRDLAQQRPMTLLTASRLPAISEAAVLADLLTSQPTTTALPQPAVGAIAGRSPEQVFAGIQRSIDQAREYLNQLPYAAFYRTPPSQQHDAPNNDAAS